METTLREPTILLGLDSALEAREALAWMRDTFTNCASWKGDGGHKIELWRADELDAMMPGMDWKYSRHAWFIMMGGYYHSFTVSTQKTIDATRDWLQGLRRGLAIAERAADDAKGLRWAMYVRRYDDHWADADLVVFRGTEKAFAAKRKKFGRLVAAWASFEYGEDPQYLSKDRWTEPQYAEVQP